MSAPLSGARLHAHALLGQLTARHPAVSASPPQTTCRLQGRVAGCDWVPLCLCDISAQSHAKLQVRELVHRGCSRSQRSTSSSCAIHGEVAHFRWATPLRHRDRVHAVLYACGCCTSECFTVAYKQAVIACDTVWHFLYRQRRGAAQRSPLRS
jgi:hypothetical protein